MIDTLHLPNIGSEPDPMPSMPNTQHETSDWLKRASVAALAVGMLAGCTEGTDATKPNTVTPAVNSSASPETHVSGPCNVPSSEQTRATALRCEDAMKAGRVALVSFSTIPASELKLLKTQIPAAVSRGTDGILHVAVDTVPASTAAQDHFQKATSANDCIEPGEPEQFASTAAEATMPELQKYDYIVGISDASSCNNDALGSTDPTYRRDADVWNANTTPETAEAIAAAHEIGHLYMLGHAGTLTGIHGTQRSDLGGLNYSESKHLNLKSYLATGEYEAYGGGYVDEYLMGSGQQGVEDLRPNALQDASLEWPQAVLKNDGPVAKKISGSEWQSITVHKSGVNSYHTVQLPKPMATNVSSNDSTVEKPADTSFTQLNLVPVITSEGFYSVDIVVSDQYKNLASLGEWFLFNQKSVGHIAIGDKTVEFKRAGDKLLTRIV